MATLTNEELATLIKDQLPRLLSEEPDLKIPLYTVFLDSFVDKTDFASFQRNFAEFQKEVRDSFKEVGKRFEKVDQRFEKVDQRFDKLEQTVTDGFDDVKRQIDRLGQRWGIRSESLFRATMADILEESYGCQVERRVISGEEFDIIISNGDHILIEITASVKRNIQKRLERKRDLYIEETGVTPKRFILAVAHISRKRAQALENAGFDVIDPDEDDQED